MAEAVTSYLYTYSRRTRLKSRRVLLVTFYVGLLSLYKPVPKYYQTLGHGALPHVFQITVHLIQTFSATEDTSHTTLLDNFK
jgi:hypothetical protein